MKKMLLLFMVSILVLGLAAIARADVISYAVSWNNIYDALFTFYNADGDQIYPTITLPAYTEKASATINGAGSTVRLGPQMPSPH